MLLEREGYIDGYRAVLRRDQIGLGLTVFLGVKIEGHANDTAVAFEEVVVSFPEVVACHMVSVRPTTCLKSLYRT